MSDPVLDLLETVPTPAMRVDETAVVTRGRIRVRRRRWAGSVTGGVAAACAAGVAVAAWPVLQPNGSAVTPAGSGTYTGSGTPTASATAPAVVNPPNTSSRQPVPCGTSARLFADTEDNFLGGDTSRRVVVHTDTCRGVMISAGGSDSTGERWAAGYTPVDRS
ncbi:MAG: hypothetical protein ACRCZD_04185, partial [Phycicoccus sp.]